LGYQGIKSAYQGSFPSDQGRALGWVFHRERKQKVDQGRLKS
jgi:hypothetical protein